MVLHQDIFKLYQNKCLEKFKNNGIQNCKIEGKESNDWKLIDGIGRYCSYI